MTKKQERACVFPVRETPERFDEFFDGGSKHEGDRIRAELYGDRAQAAFRSVQPFRIHEAILLGVEVTDTYEQEYRWSELYRLTQLEPRQASPARPHGLVAELVYWMSNGPLSAAGLAAVAPSPTVPSLGTWSARTPTSVRRCSTTST